MQAATDRAEAYLRRILTNHELASAFADLEALRIRKNIRRFLRWIADEPSDFHAPTWRAVML